MADERRHGPGKPGGDRGNIPALISALTNNPHDPVRGMPTPLTKAL